MVPWSPDAQLLQDFVIRGFINKQIQKIVVPRSATNLTLK